MMDSTSPDAPQNEQPTILEINLDTKFGKLRGRIPVPSQGMRLSEFALNSLALDERLINMAVASEAKAGRPVSCQKGCGACCRQAVPISPAEAWMLADLVQSFPAEKRVKVIARFTEAMEKLKEHGFGDRSLNGKATDQEVLNLGLDYFRLQIACPFLEDESCSIHPYRPSSCREYLVSSAPANCSNPGEGKLEPIPLATSLTEALSKLCAMIMGTEPQVIPMTLALQWATERKAESKQKYDATLLFTALIELLGAPSRNNSIPD